MKAIVCNEYGPLQHLALQEVDNPIPEDKELLLKVLAAGINFPDGLLVQGLYQAKPETPFIPGMEFCGEVIGMGADVKSFNNGDRIISSSPSYGAFAEQVTLPAAMAIRAARNQLVATQMARPSFRSASPRWKTRSPQPVPG